MRFNLRALGMALLGLGGLAWVGAALASSAPREAVACGVIGTGFLAAAAATALGRTRWTRYALVAATLGSAFPVATSLGSGSLDLGATLFAVGVAVAAAASFGSTTLAGLGLRMGLAVAAIGVAFWVVPWLLTPTFSDPWTIGNFLTLAGGVVATLHASPAVRRPVGQPVAFAVRP